MSSEALWMVLVLAVVFILLNTRSRSCCCSFRLFCPDQVEERLKFYDTGEAPRKNVAVMEKVAAEIAREGGEIAEVSTPSSQKKKKKRERKEEESVGAVDEAPSSKKKKKKSKKSKE